MVMTVGDAYARSIPADGGGLTYFRYWHLDRFTLTQGSVTNPEKSVEFWGHFYASDGAGGKVHDRERTTHCKVPDVASFIAAMMADGSHDDAETLAGINAMIGAQQSSTAIVWIALQAAMAETMNKQLPQYGRSFEVVA